jgi:hypothetical protein
VKKTILISVGLFVVFWLFANYCFQPTGRHNMVTRDHAIEIAEAEMAKHGRIASDYEITVDREISSGDDWIVWFEKKGPFRVPGGRHGVRVSKSTGHAEYLPGQ